MIAANKANPATSSFIQVAQAQTTQATSICAL